MATSRAILTKRLDLLLGGGLSLVVLVVLLLFRPEWLDAAQPHHLALGALLVNYPHFMASSWLVYRSKTMVKRHPWAAIYFPLLLALLCASSVAAAQQSRLGLELILLANGIYLAWHYTGQTWGMVAAFAAVEGVPPEPLEGRLVRGSMRILLAFHVLWALLVQQEFPTLAARLREFTVFGSALIALAAVVGLTGFVRWSRRTGHRLPTRVWMPWAALLGWYSAMALHPNAISLVQIGHALQYLPFALRVEVNRETGAPTSRRTREAVGFTLAWLACVALVWLGPAGLLGVRLRPAAVPGLAVATLVGLLLLILAVASAVRPGRSIVRPFFWAALMIQGGCVVFGFLPSVLSRVARVSFGDPGLGADATAMLFCFVNLHHYFTDGVAWKLRNPEVSREVFAHLRERSPVESVG